MPSFWRRNKATIALGLVGAGKALLDNYWIFTNLPLVDTEGSETTSKVFYMLGQVILTSTLSAAMGYIIDHLDDKPSQSSELVNLGQYSTFSLGVRP